ncbi:hypothetical protein ABWH88_06615 [Marinobacter adhaerens]|uniref:Uncharacterized protein n=2 Tax=Marinobacter adhaerens TaxID=1033846 RepID=A0ABX8IP29_9GAMM|nr:hypothetical protein [Marinobacter adhaerens]MBW4979545.1 hypothetical protein [Marinobacter adhaerens]QWV14454.1 hypothetical protein KQ249_07635 [Marinobacter adhaerens]
MSENIPFELTDGACCPECGTKMIPITHSETEIDPWWCTECGFNEPVDSEGGTDIDGGTIEHREDQLDCALSGQSKQDRLIDSVHAELCGVAYNMMLSHTISGNWPDSEAATKVKHDQLLALAYELRKLKIGPEQADQVPEGYALVPDSMCLSYEDIESIITMTGWDEGRDDFGEGVLWVGTLKDDDGKETYGLHISCIEVMEEGALPVQEFQKPPLTTPTPATTSEQGSDSVRGDLRCQQCGNMEPFHATGCAQPYGEFAATTPETESFQSRVQPWLLECFGAMIAGDKEERNHRFLEEALELVQSLRCTADEAHKLVDYVFSRPVGDPPQEVGGVQVTLAALCLANAMDMHQCGETELARITQPEMVEKIREKQKRKPSMSPLPGVYPDRPAPPQEQ